MSLVTRKPVIGVYSNLSAKLQRLAYNSLNFLEVIKKVTVTADQNVRMNRLVCIFFVCTH